MEIISTFSLQDIFPNLYFSLLDTVAAAEVVVVMATSDYVFARYYQRYFNLMHFILRFHAHSFVRICCCLCIGILHTKLYTCRHTVHYQAVEGVHKSTFMHLSKCMLYSDFQHFCPFLFVIFWLNVDVEVTD